MGGYGQFIGKWVKLSAIPPPPPHPQLSVCVHGLNLIFTKNGNHSFSITSLITFLCIILVMNPINLNKSSSQHGNNNIIIHCTHYIFLVAKSLLLCSLHVQCIVSKRNLNLIACNSVFDVIFFKTMYNKTLLVLVFVMSRIIKVSVSVISFSLRLSR